MSEMTNVVTSGAVEVLRADTIKSTKADLAGAVNTCSDCAIW